MRQAVTTPRLRGRPLRRARFFPALCSLFLLLTASTARPAEDTMRLVVDPSTNHHDALVEFLDREGYWPEEKAEILEPLQGQLSLGHETAAVRLVQALDDIPGLRPLPRGVLEFIHGHHNTFYVEAGDDRLLLGVSYIFKGKIDQPSAIHLEKFDLVEGVHEDLGTGHVPGGAFVDFLRAHGPFLGGYLQSQLVWPFFLLLLAWRRRRLREADGDPLVNTVRAQVQDRLFLTAAVVWSLHVLAQLGLMHFRGGLGFMELLTTGEGPSFRLVEDLVTGPAPQPLPEHGPGSGPGRDGDPDPGGLGPDIQSQPQGYQRVGGKTGWSGRGPAMIPLLQKAGLPGVVLFLWTVVGSAWALVYCLWWWRQHDPVAGALRAAEEALQAGRSPRAQYEAGRAAALAAATSPAGNVFTGSMAIWLAVILMAALVLLVTTPHLGLVADLMRGVYDLEGNTRATEVVARIESALINGTLATVFLIPSVLLAGLALGFVRGWLLGAPVDRALLATIAQVDGAHENAGHRELPPLRDLALRLKRPSSPHWHVSGFVLGPFWYLLHGRYRRLAGSLVVVLLLGLAGHLIWSQVPRVVGAEQLVLGGVPLDGLWHHLRESLITVLVLPLLWHTAVRGREGPGA
jgi:hypothetical protein